MNDGILGWAIRRALWIIVGGVAAALMANDMFERLAAVDPGGGDIGQQTAAGPLPAPPPAPPSSRTMILEADAGGRFSIDGRINEEPVRFVVDTGETRIALAPETAARAGIRVRERDFVREPNVSGEGAAPVTIRHLEVGSMSLFNVPASVTERPMPDEAVLGTTFLRGLDGYEVRGDRMTLHW